MDNFPSTLDHIFIWAFGIIIPFLMGLQSDRLSDQIVFDSRSRIKLYIANSIMLAIAGSSILLLWLATKRNAKTLGFTEINNKYSAVVLIIIILFFLIYLIDVLYNYKSIKQKSSTPEWIKKYSFLPHKNKEIPSYLLLCACAGIFEEIIYRGFMVTYFMPTISNEFPWLAISVPAFLFSMAHYYQGWTAVVKIMVFSILFNVIFIYSGSIYPSMIIHFLIDLLSGMFYMNQLKKTIVDQNQ